MNRPQFVYIHESHLDLFWLGSYHTCLERGNHILKQYLDRCTLYDDETFLIETVVFLKHFLQTHPEYREIVKRLWSRGQIDIGCAYIDAWQNIVLGESHVRNLVEGRSWLKQELGIDSRLAAHPDLPGLTPQTPQIYAGAGVRYYATSRKNFRDGAVWMYVAPDGSELMVFNHPRQYIFNPLEGDEVSKDRNDHIRIEQTLKGFPMQKVILSGGTGDLADMRNFKRRMGRDLRETLVEYKHQYPQIDFSFGTISGVLRDYEAVKTELPHLQGEIPSVWGIDESAAFFHTARRLEGKLLAAGFMEALGRLYGLDHFAPTRGPWFGIYHEHAFFREKDPIPQGDELPSLWRMHLFTQDHNGGGQEGALSEFHKRTMQDRAITYADQMIAHCLQRLAAQVQEKGQLLLVNPLSTFRYEPTVLEVPKHWIGPDFSLIRPNGEFVPWQGMDQTDSAATTARIAVACPMQGGSYQLLSAGPPSENSNQVAISEEPTCISVDAGHLSIAVNRRSGALESILDRRTGVDWGSTAVNQLYAIAESGTDTTLRADESHVLASDHVHSVEIAEAGPVFVKIKICKSILKAHVEQDVTVWLQGLDLIDITTTIWWHGMHNVQLRQCLPTAEGRESVSYGTPFYGSGWVNVVPDSGPNANDEMTPEDYPFYREAQMWLHQCKGESAMALATHHPTFHWGRSGLEALLLRTPKSCGDARLYWENSGRQEFSFRLKLGAAAEHNGWAYRLGQQALCPVLAAAAPGGGGPLPSAESFLQIDADHLVVSSVYPEADGILVRLVETRGIPTEARLKIRGIHRYEKVTLDAEGLGVLPADERGCPLQVKPYEIVTIRCFGQA